MIQFAYSDVLEDDQTSAKEREFELFQEGIGLMKASDAEPAHIGKRAEAIYYNSRLWTRLLDDLASAENALTDELKANLISIGIFVIKHFGKMREDKSLDFSIAIELSETINRGLSSE